MKLSRRTMVAVLAGSLAGCQAVPGMEGNRAKMIESSVEETVFVERWVKDLPVPDQSPALGVTNEGIVQYSTSEDAWVSFDWASVFGVSEDGSVRLGTEEDPVDSLSTRTVNGIPQVRERADGGSGTKADPYVVPPGLLSDYHGTVDFGTGWFVTDGLATDAAADYDRSSVYLEGEGIRTTTLRHAAAAPSTPTVSFEGRRGNFGGIRDMTVFGAGEGERAGSANIVETDGSVIDYQFENVIIRWGGGDVLKINSSGSGTRVTNAWLENADGWAFHLAGGERVKVDNVHTTGTIGGVKTDGTLGNYSNLTLTHFQGGDGILSTSNGNQFSNVTVRSGANKGVSVWGSNNAFSNVYLADLSDVGFEIGAPTSISNVVAADFGTDVWDPMFDIKAGNTVIGNAVAKGGDGGRMLFRIRENVDRCHLDGIGGVPGVRWRCVIESGAVENVIDDLYGVAYRDVTDEGTRTLINRWGTNAGNPNRTGEWNGHAEYAGRCGATVWDTTTTPWTGYRATPNGSWRSIDPTGAST